jgi:hypothetical protein
LIRIEWNGDKAEGYRLEDEGKSGEAESSLKGVVR